MKKTTSNMKSGAKESTQKLSSMNEVVTQWKKDILLGREKPNHAHVHGKDNDGMSQNLRAKAEPIPGDGTDTEPTP